METSTSSPVRPMADQQGSPVSQKREAEENPPLSQKTGIHRVRPIDHPQPYQERASMGISNSSQGQARPLESRQGSHCKTTCSINGQISATSESGKDNDQQAVYKHFEEKLMTLAGLEHSKYPRRYPPGVMTTRQIRGPFKRNELSACCQEVQKKFANTLKSKGFFYYMIDKGIKNPFAYITTSENIQLELYTQFIFKNHPALGQVSFSNRHANTLLFPDEFIHKIYSFDQDKTKTVGGIEILLTQNNKPVIQQQNSTSSGAAIVAMFACEQGKKIQPERLQRPNFDNQDCILNELQHVYNIPCQKKEISALSCLSKTIKQNHSVAVLVTNGEKNCWVAVDEVDFELGSIRCRNPYNCEEVEVKQQAFCNMWCIDQGVVLIPSLRVDIKKFFLKSFF